MNCKQCEQLLWVEAEGQLSPAEAQALQAHLRTCVHCQRQREVVHATYRALSTLPRYRAPEHTLAQVKARLQAPAQPAWWQRWRRVALAPALGLLLALGWWGWQQYSYTPDTPTTAAVNETEHWIELHQQLEVAEWSPTPTPDYFLFTGHSR